MSESRSASRLKLPPECDSFPSGWIARARCSATCHSLIGLCMAHLCNASNIHLKTLRQAPRGELRARARARAPSTRRLISHGIQTRGRTKRKFTGAGALQQVKTSRKLVVSELHFYELKFSSTCGMSTAVSIRGDVSPAPSHFIKHNRTPVHSF